ncbi:MAG TPA: hypothetical protein VGF54_05720 [Streptosporangiaceae bacterium]|jgi:hypothetical protein
MQYRFVFVVGLGVGFVLGARAGRERYEQLVKLTRKAKDSPAVQQAAGAVQAQAAGLVKTAKGKVAERVPKLTEGARSKAGAARSKVGSTLHDHGVGAKNSHGRPASDGRGGQQTSAPDASGGNAG